MPRKPTVSSSIRRARSSPAGVVRLEAALLTRVCLSAGFFRAGARRPFDELEPPSKRWPELDGNYFDDAIVDDENHFALGPIGDGVARHGWRRRELDGPGLLCRGQECARQLRQLRPVGPLRQPTLACAEQTSCHANLPQGSAA